MKIELDLGYYEAIALRRQLQQGPHMLALLIAEDICAALTTAIDNEEQRRLDRAQNVNAGHYKRRERAEMSIQINVHLEADKSLKAKTVFATILEISKLPMVCFQLDEMNIYFHSHEQIDQVLTALAEAREKMAELWATTVGLALIPPSRVNADAPEGYSHSDATSEQKRKDYFDAKRRGGDV